MQFTQFKSILELVQHFNSEQICTDYLEQLRWNGNVISPFDENSKVYKCAGNKYKCKNTGKYFNVRTGTMFDDTKMPLQKWYMAIYLVASHKKGISSYQLGRDLNITQKSAWFLLHRIRYAFGHENFQNELGNIVEADETYVGGKEKNKHNNKKVGGTQGRSVKEKTAVLGMLERDGNVKAIQVENTKSETIAPILLNNIKVGSKLMTDEWWGYRGMNAIYDHQIVKHAYSEYVRGNVHTNTIEGFWSLFKRGVVGIYHFVSKKHIQQYLNEFSYRYNSRRISDAHRFALVLANSNVRLKYSDLIK